MAVSYVTCAPFCTRNHVHASPASSASADKAAERTGIESSSNVGVTSRDSTRPDLDPLATALGAMPDTGSGGSRESDSDE